ncbi:unnamed protein product, partial [Discosporangium mesarthrocarpum]
TSNHSILPSSGTLGMKGKPCCFPEERLPIGSSPRESGRVMLTGQRGRRDHRDHALASELSLADLQQRVKATTAEKERIQRMTGKAIQTAEGFGPSRTPGKDRIKGTSGSTSHTYEALVKYQIQATSLVASLKRSESARAVAAQRRQERLANFRQLQDELLLRIPSLVSQNANHYTAPEDTGGPGSSS